MQQTGFLDPAFATYYEQTDNDRTADIAFYLRKAREANGLVLEAGCGSGRLLIPLLEVGVAIEGFDYSPVMLDHLSKRLAEKGLSARVWQCRLEGFESEENQYALIICAFNTFAHLLDHIAQLSALRRMHRALKPGGKLILDITNPTNFDIFSRHAMTKTFEATLFDGDTDTPINIWRWFDRDLITQTGVYHREYEPDGKPEETIHTQVEFRWTFPEEMKLLFAAAGFSEREVFGDFNDETLDEDSEMQVWVARKL